MTAIPELQDGYLKHSERPVQVCSSNGASEFRCESVEVATNADEGTTSIDDANEAIILVMLMIVMIELILRVSANLRSFLL